MRHLHFAFLLALTTGCATTPVKPPDRSPTPYVSLKILAINDFHGNIQGPTGTVKVAGRPVEAGGGEHLARRIKEIRKYHPNSIVVGAGDMVGASPLLSSIFHDEPAIEALNEAQLEINAVGNHEFDEGVDELKRLANGGCHPQDGCQDNDPFEGAKFKFLAGNVIQTSSGETVFPAYEIRVFEGVKVGFIGLTLQGTGEILAPKAREGLTFLDEAETINKAAAELQTQGVQAIVVLIHEGGYPANRDDPNQCEGISGPILDIVKNMDKAVDIVVSGHTHQPYICEIDNRLVTSAKAYGQLVTEIDVKLSKTTGDVVERSAINLVVDDQGPADPQVQALINKYQDVIGPLAGRTIGTITEDILERTESGTSPMGRLVADMQLWATKAPEAGGAQIAFMNPGGIRNELTFAPSKREAPGVVTFEEAHAVQPFANGLVTMTLSGAQILGILEQQWKQKRPRVLHISSGFEYTWSASAPAGSKVVPGSAKLNGQPLDPNANYRVTVNSYVAGGGDRFETFQQGTDRVTGPLDLEAFDAYFGANSPVNPPTDQRIHKVD